MRKMIFIISVAVLAAAMVSCNGSSCCQKKIGFCTHPEKAMVTEAVQEGSNDFEQVEIVGNKVVYTHIYDGIIDVKTYAYDGDTCVEVVRSYVFPDQLSALHHYRRAIEQAELYDDVQLVKNELRYDLKEVQHKLETAGLTKEQLKAKLEKQLAEAKKVL